jgi:site-specific recombinase XerD
MDAILEYLSLSRRREDIIPTDFIFTSSLSANSDHPISANQVRRMLNQYLKAAGLITHFRVHDLRHTAAMLYKVAGEDIESIQAILDHENVNTTAVYLHAIEGHATQAWRAVGKLLGMTEAQNRVHESRIAPQDSPKNEGAIRIQSERKP